MQSTVTPHTNTSAAMLPIVNAFRNEVAQIALLDQEQEQALAERVRVGDEEARTALIESLQRYLLVKAWHLVNYFQASQRARVEVMDAVMEGNLAILTYLDRAVAAPNPCAFLRKAAAGVMLNYCKEHRTLIRTPRTPGAIPRRVVSLDAPIGEGECSLGDLLAGEGVRC